MKTLIVALIVGFPSNVIFKLFDLWTYILIHKYFRTRIFHELLDIRFSRTFTAIFAVFAPSRIATNYEKLY